KGEAVNIANVAASFQQAVMDVIVTKTMRAAIEKREEKLVLAGGVAANSKLREMMGAACKKAGIQLICPSLILCTDNAAMIGCAAYYKYKAGMVDDLTLDAHPNLPL
ncbi:MAG: tRNA (adenosine(37)-N6)-threonylcarbamoyltransferase complex transferase subunit TsaD, partial [Anaerovorax sp.]